MTDPRAYLEDVLAKADAATPGPWAVTDLRNAPDGNRDCLWVDARPVGSGTRSYRTVAEMTEDEGLNVIWTLEDAAHIAASRTTAPAMARALLAVIDMLGKRDADSTGDEYIPASRIYAAITTELAKEEQK